jgi:hypothetical protein
VVVQQSQRNKVLKDIGVVLSSEKEQDVEEKVKIG